MSRRRSLHVAATLVAIPALLVACGDDDEDGTPVGSPPPTPDLAPIDTPTTGGTSAGSSDPGDADDHQTFCTNYERLEATFETAGEATIEEARAQLATLGDEFERLQSEVPDEIADHWVTLIDGVEEMTAMANEATDIQALQAALAAFPAESIDAAGRAVEEWSQANC